MDNDKIVSMIQKLQGMLDAIDPTEAKYSIILDMLTKCQKLKSENDEACDKQNERQNKLDLEKLRLEKEVELKLKELELRYALEEKKVKADSEEAARRRRAEKRNAIWDIIKLLVQIIGSAALIAFTGKIEQSVIIGNHKWSLLQKIFKV